MRKDSGERVSATTDGGQSMTDSDVDELGPVDYIVVEFPADTADFSGAMAAELTALIKRGTIRLLD
jgi:hypothetical protein